MNDSKNSTCHARLSDSFFMTVLVKIVMQFKMATLLVQVLFRILVLS
jgi:hypothetical protein